MRKELEIIDEVRQTFYGTFVRTGYKKRHVKTVLMRDILDASGKLMTDHVWFNYTKGFNDIEPIRPGDQIRFNARVKEYRKGSIKRGIKVEYDYKLSHPSKVTLMTKAVKMSNESLSNPSVYQKLDQFDIDSFNTSLMNHEDDNSSRSQSSISDNEDYGSDVEEDGDGDEDTQEDGCIKDQKKVDNIIPDIDINDDLAAGDVEPETEEIIYSKYRDKVMDEDDIIQAHINREIINRSMKNVCNSLSLRTTQVYQGASKDLDRKDTNMIIYPKTSGRRDKKTDIVVNMIEPDPEPIEQICEVYRSSSNSNYNISNNNSNRNSSNSSNSNLNSSNSNSNNSRSTNSQYMDLGLEHAKSSVIQSSILNFVKGHNCIARVTNKNNQQKTQLKIDKFFRK